MEQIAIARQIRELIGVDNTIAADRVGPIVASLAGIEADTPHGTLIRVGLYLQKQIVGRVVDGFVLRSWRGAENVRLYRFAAVETVESANEIDAVRRELREACREMLALQRRIESLTTRLDNATA